MTLQQRLFAGDADLRAMAALVEAFPEHNLHVVDLPYRLCSWGRGEPGNIGLWFNADGELQAWVVVQTPFWCVDIVLHPAEEALYPRRLAWAEQRAAALLNGPYGRPAWFVHVPARQNSRRPALEAAGFSSQADKADNPWSMVHMQHSGQPMPENSTPAGFTIRPLAGQAEVAGYVACHQAAFESDTQVYLQCGPAGACARWRTRPTSRIWT